MHAHMPPFTRKSESAPELGRSAVAAHTLADGLVHAAPVRTAAALPITGRESDLRTLKHYLYHAGLLVEKLLAPEQLSPLKRLDSGAIAADFTRDRDATGA